MLPESTRDWRLYADDILEACGKVRRYVAGMTYETVVADDRTRDAVIRNVEVIGEAAKRLPDDVIARAPEVPWRKVRGMRHRGTRIFRFGQQARVEHRDHENR